MKLVGSDEDREFTEFTGTVNQAFVVNQSTCRDLSWLLTLKAPSVEMNKSLMFKITNWTQNGDLGQDHFGVVTSFRLCTIYTCCL